MHRLEQTTDPIQTDKVADLVDLFSADQQVVESEVSSAHKVTHSSAFSSSINLWWASIINMLVKLIPRPGSSDIRAS